MGMENLQNINDDNRFAKLLYNKPIKGLLKKRIYYKKKVKPVIKELEKESPSFSTMVEFSNFIKILEMVWFYYNDSKTLENNEKDVRIISDNNIENDTKKNLTIIMEKKHVSIIFNLNKISDPRSEESRECIVVTCNNLFGKKMKTVYEIENRQIVSNQLNDNTHALLFNINSILQKAMIDLIKEYYKKA